MARNSFFYSKTQLSNYDDNFKEQNSSHGINLGLLYTGKLTDNIDFNGRINLLNKRFGLYLNEQGYNNVQDFFIAYFVTPEIQSLGVAFDLSYTIKRFNRGFSLGILTGARIGYDIQTGIGDGGTYTVLTKNPADTFTCESKSSVLHFQKLVPEIYGGIRFNKDINEHRLFSVELSYNQDLLNTTKFIYNATIYEGSIAPKFASSSKSYNAIICPRLSFLSIKFILYPFFRHSKKDQESKS